MRPNGIITGRPTEPQVRTLMEAFPKIDRGQTIEHQQIAAVIGEKAGSGRYRSVLNAWRKRVLADKGIHFRAVPTVGVRAVEANEQVREGSNRLRSAGRRIAAGIKIVERTPESELTPAMRGERMHILTRGAILVATIRADRREIEYRIGQAGVMPKLKPA